MLYNKLKYISLAGEEEKAKSMILRSPKRPVRRKKLKYIQIWIRYRTAKV